MKTTLDIDDEVLSEAKKRAADSGLTLKSFVEDTLRARLLPAPAVRKPFRLDAPVVRGVAPPAADVMDRRTLHDVMDERE